MKISGVVRHFSLCISDLITERHFYKFAERHGPVAVHARLRIVDHRERVDPREQIVSYRKEVGERDLDRRRLFMIPIEPQDIRASEPLDHRPAGHRQPLLNDPRSVDTHDGHRLFRRYRLEGPHLPAGDEVCRTSGMRQVRIVGIRYGHAAAPFLSGGIFCGIWIASGHCSSVAMRQGRG